MVKKIPFLCLKFTYTIQNQHLEKKSQINKLHCSDWPLLEPPLLERNAQEKLQILLDWGLFINKVKCCENTDVLNNKIPL